MLMLAATRIDLVAPLKNELNVFLRSTIFWGGSLQVWPRQPVLQVHSNSFVFTFVQFVEPGAWQGFESQGLVAVLQFLPTQPRLQR